MTWWMLLGGRRDSFDRSYINSSSAWVTQTGAEISWLHEETHYIQQNLRQHLCDSSENYLDDFDRNIEATVSHEGSTRSQTCHIVHINGHKRATDTAEDGHWLDVVLSGARHRLVLMISPIQTSPKQPCPSFLCSKRVSLDTSQASRPRPMVRGVELGQGLVR